MKIAALIKKLGAQVVRLLTIRDRQNLQLLTSSKSGLYGQRLSRTVPAVVPARLVKISAESQNFCARLNFHHFLWKSQIMYLGF
jgi:hypothetical protein